MPDHVGQPVTSRQVLMEVLPKQAGADDFEEHRYLSLLATVSEWMMRVLVERLRQHPKPDVPRRFHNERGERRNQGSFLSRTENSSQFDGGEHGHLSVFCPRGCSPRHCGTAGTTCAEVVGARCCKRALSSLGQSTHRRRGLDTET